MNFTDLLKRAQEYFNLAPDKENERQTIELISSGVSFRGATLWVLMLAILIASLGLNVNSTAVIIGAMLISPLMGPIIGMGLAIGINDLGLLRRSLKNYAVATLISVLTATVFFLISPLGEAQSELLARTSPSLYDVLIAFFGGAAGILAICTRGKGNVIPGVAIATALMPPLCTAGYGLAKGQWLYFGGAFYLFFINTVFIALATYVGVRMLKFSKIEETSRAKSRRASRIISAIIVATIIPAVYLTILIVHKSVIQNNVKRFVTTELRQSGTQILSSDITGDHELRVVAVGKEISREMRNDARKRMSFYGLDNYRLKVIQGSQSDSLLVMSRKLDVMVTTGEASRKQVLELTARNSALQSTVDNYEKYRSLTGRVAAEVHTLFPSVSSVGIMPMTQATIGDSVVSRPVIVALVSCAQPLSQHDGARLAEWLKTRCQVDSLQIVISQK